MKHWILVGFFLLSLSASGAETEASFKAAFEAAEAARKKAAEHGHEWRDTEKILNEARAAAEKGDYDKAVELAVKAKFQGEMAVRQAMEQARIWRQAVPKP